MKNVLKVFGIIALAAVMGFSFSACSTDDGGGEGEKGRTLTITGLEAYEGKEVGVSQYPIEQNVLIQDGHKIFIGSIGYTTIVDGKATLTMGVSLRDGIVTGGVPYVGKDNNVNLNISFKESGLGLRDVTADFSAGNATVAYPAE